MKAPYKLELTADLDRPWIIRRLLDGHVVFRLTGHDRSFAEQILANLLYGVKESAA